MEILVYNVSHIDLVIGMNIDADKLSCIKYDNDETTERQEEKQQRKLVRKDSSGGKFIRFNESQMPEIFSRPKFSYFQPVGEAMLNSLNECKNYIDLNVDVYGTHEESSKSTKKLTIGMGLRKTDPKVKGLHPWNIFHFRKGTVELLKGYDEDKKKIVQPSLRSVYLPVFAQALELWRYDTKKKAQESKKQIILLCGAGRPRNNKHQATGNSTLATAKLISKFLKSQYPEIDIVILDSGLDVFLYDENVTYMRKHLLPIIESHRRKYAKICQENGFHDSSTWKDHVRVTIALTEGPAARISAMQASLRTYKPAYLHAWQLKTFWHEQRLIKTDMQTMSFSKVETQPLNNVKNLNHNEKLIAGEMLKFKTSFENQKQDGLLSELNRFWLRKTRKPVLAVLMVQLSPTEQPIFFRGINLEVSMVTGSICAERNAIGTALTSNLNIQRKHFKSIAVLSLPKLDKIEESTATTTTTTTTTTTAAAKTVGQGNIDGILKKNTNASIYDDTTNFAIKDDGLNPIEPCGACVEWLRKICEVQPDFKVITFASTKCLSAFVKEVE